MPLERYVALLGKKDPAELRDAQVDWLEPDNFPVLKDSELAAPHKDISQLMRDVTGMRHGADLKNHDAVIRLSAESEEIRTGYYLALLERIFAYNARLSHAERHRFSWFFDYGSAAGVLSALHEKGVDNERVVLPTLLWFNSYRFIYYGIEPLMKVLEWLASVNARRKLSDEERHRLILLRSQFADREYGVTEESLALIDSLLGNGPWRVLAPCEVWTVSALDYLGTLSAEKREDCLNLLRHCLTANSARPSGKWLKNGQALLEKVGRNEIHDLLLKCFPLVDAGRTNPLASAGWENVDEKFRMSDRNADILKGLLWLCPKIASPELTRATTRLAISAYRKIPGVGPRAVKVGNAAVYALSEIGNIEAVGQLAILQARVKFGTALKEVEKAFTKLAETLGLPRDEMEEMAVPVYGLTEVGRCRETFGEFTAELKVIGTTEIEVSWQNAEGKPQKSTPKIIKEKFNEDWKELQTAAKDIQKMLPVQKERIDNLFLKQKQWALKIWRERYLDHPLVGVLARRLLWDFLFKDRKVTGIWYEGHLVDIDLNPLEVSDDEVQVQLWHPIGKDLDEVIGWREWFDAQQIQQPFKQAHRELYVLTDAERNTRIYSNRYAAHVLKQHQFNALCALRGWKNQLRLMVDAEYLPATIYLPQWGLRAEFWIEGAGDDYGTDTNDAGTYLYLTTDQVRFYPMNAPQRAAHAGGGGYHPSYHQQDGEPMLLSDIPPLVFSEVMRDVDMFVGVASVGNDAAWSDGGPEGRYRDYWNSYSFGDLGATARTRKEVLQKLVPRLKIAGVCSFEEKFLIVKGKMRTYKIHLGSGNILMEPNDQYLCIVAKQGVVEENSMFLPFEGDRILSLIISKAFLLAADDKIKDPTILSQLQK